MKKVVLQFTRNITPYVKGDIATFTENDAERYVKAKVAEVLKEEKSVVSPKVDKQIKGATEQK